MSHNFRIFTLCFIVVIFTACQAKRNAVDQNSQNVGYAVSQSGSGTSFSQNADLVQAGGNYSVTVSADAGYAVSAIVGGNCPAGTWSADTYTTGAITGPCSLSFNAIPNQSLQFVPDSHSELDLTWMYNSVGIYRDGSTFSSSGGWDDFGQAFSTTHIDQVFSYQSVDFKIGDANANNVFKPAAGMVFAVPGGQYQALQILGSAINGAQENQTIILTYADGGKTFANQSFSDWSGASHGYANEIPVIAADYINNYDGSKHASGNHNLFAYQIELDSTRTLTGIELPANSDIRIFALNLGQSFAP